jgi:hypothetical protein
MTQIPLIPLSGETGTLILYEVCPIDPGIHTKCLGRNFLLWNN